MLSNHALPRGLRRLRHLGRRDESGAALVEFALVFGIFVFILYALIAFGMMLATKQSITNASAEAARATVGSADFATAEATAKATVTQRLDWLGSNFNVNDSSQFSAVAVPCVSSATTSDCIKVSVTYNYSANPLVPPAPGLNLITPNKFSSESTVKFK
ncbi:MAG: TadE family protein [Acidimicrobiales bacterium]